MIAIMLLAVLSGIVNLVVYKLLGSDPWRYTKLSSALISLLVGLVALHAYRINSNPEMNCYGIIAILLLAEQTIKAIGQIIRYVDLNRRIKLWLSQQV